MGLIQFLGRVVLSVVLSIVANMIDRYVQSRKKGKEPGSPK